MIRLPSTFLDHVGQLDQLPSLPTIVTQLMEVIDDPLASALDVAHIRHEDPPLTVRRFPLSFRADWLAARLSASPIRRPPGR